MPSINRVTLLGHLGADPDLRYTPSGSANLQVSVATSRNRKDKDGAWLQETDWHRVIVWGDAAEKLAQILSKGGLVYVEGRIQTRTWNSDDGQKHYMTEIVADKCLALDRKSPRAGSADPEPPTEAEGEARDKIRRRAQEVFPGAKVRK